MNKLICKLSIANMYKKPDVKSELVSQILFGEEFYYTSKNKNFYYGFSSYDKYYGYILVNHLKKSNAKITHRIKNTEINLFNKPNKKNKIKKKIFFNSRIFILKRQGDFVNIQNFWIEKKNIKLIKKEINFLKNIKFFLNTKYLWGGNSVKGIDCSGLIQELMKSINQKCPRDSKDQNKFFKKKIPIQKIKRGDLLFWVGHVAVAISKKKLIHAYGPKKKVTVMTIKETVSLIKKNSNLKLLCIKRPKLIN